MSTKGEKNIQVSDKNHTFKHHSFRRKNSYTPQPRAITTPAHLPPYHRELKQPAPSRFFGMGL
jgi:hypothetical protein